MHYTNLFLIISIICFFNFKSHAQSKDSLLLYYNLIEKAEEEIVLGNNINADSLYQKAFLFNRKPFAKHIKNAINNHLILNKKNQEVILAYLTLVQIIENKSIENIIDDDKKLQKLKTYTDWVNIKNFLSNTFEKKNDSLTNRIIYLLELDQQIRNKAFALYGNNFYKSPLALEIENQDIKNQNELLEIFNSNKKCEIIMTSDVVLSIYVITLHNLALGRDTLLHTLKSEVFKGNFDAYEYAKLSDMRFDYGSFNHKQIENFGTTKALIFGDYFIILENANEKEFINKCRKEIFLSDYLNALERSSWIFLNRKKDLFSFSHGFNVFGNSNEEALEILKKFKHDNINFIHYIRK